MDSISGAITYPYLCSLDWKIQIDESARISFDAENNDRLFLLEHIQSIKKWLGFVVNSTSRVILTISDKKTNAAITIQDTKIIQLYDTLIKDIIRIQEKMQKEVDL